MIAAKGETINSPVATSSLPFRQQNNQYAVEGRFAGLPLDESVPDHSTIWRFRQELTAQGLAEALFEEINRQLDARRLIVRQGTLIDATLLQASVKPPSVKEGTVSERDREAGWTKKNGKSHFGYKAHMAVDEGSDPHRDPHIRRPARQPAGGALDPRRRAIRNT